ncbi:uncharacterized protein BKCO1_25000101 [Diplodia corticola]|uniref:Uncharacterized protein n=1 Tax=Diplodia corticola TaxID=236234 RepID=A0A1J9R0G6_9PEZI|nr:uncharacterized protein BKCO1_25000101 [Diplodia corticola]OJD34089.1 hypothetical protein BKCO1_25000101 [Diplodia corticola]
MSTTSWPVPPHDDLPTVLKRMKYDIPYLARLIRTMMSEGIDHLTEMTENPERMPMHTLFPPKIRTHYTNASYYIRRPLFKLKRAAEDDFMKLNRRPRPLTRKHAMQELGMQLATHLGRLDDLLDEFGGGVRSVCGTLIKLIKADKDVSRKAEGSKYMLEMYKRDPWYVHTERAHPKAWDKFRAVVKATLQVVDSLEKTAEECRVFLKQQP